jgi:SAM-dependent methyltransferase
VIVGYDLGVERYEELWSPVILPAAAAVVPWLGLADHSVVLDVGGETGALVTAIRTLVPTASVLVVDASAEMLRVARIQRDLPAVQADAMVLPVAAETVHAVVLAYVLFHLADHWRRSKRPTPASHPCRHVVSMPGWTPHRESMNCSVPRVSRRGTVWSERLLRQLEPTSFWAHLSGSGVNRQRLAMIDPGSRSVLLASVREKLDKLAPQDYWWEGEVICAVAAKAASSNGRG